MSVVVGRCKTVLIVTVVPVAGGPTTAAQHTSILKRGEREDAVNANNLRWLLGGVRAPSDPTVTLSSSLAAEALHQEGNQRRSSSRLSLPR